MPSCFLKVIFFGIIDLALCVSIQSLPIIALTRNLLNNHEMKLLLTSADKLGCKVKCVELPCISCDANSNAKKLSSIGNFDAVVVTSPKVNVLFIVLFSCIYF